MTYGEASAYLESFINFERRPDPADWSKVKLERVFDLLHFLGDPHRAGRMVHIAGSKGKGSTAAMVAAILQAAGHRTGLYTSPHLISPRERIQVSGAPIEREAVARLVGERLRPAVAAYQNREAADELTFFDLHTALAFAYLEEMRAEWSVIEVGLGGRLDATNVITPRVAAITAISLDHTALLGETLDRIAVEKAGIIKPGVPVVTAPQSEEVAKVLEETAASRGARLVPASGAEGVAGAGRIDLADGRVGQAIRVSWPGEAPRELVLPLLGAHQVENAAVARTIAELLDEVEPGSVDLEAVVKGLGAVQWPGRLQVLERNPWLVLDGAHNAASAARLAESFALFPHRRRFLLLAAARDKDFGGIAASLCPGVEGVVLTGLPDNPRTAEPEALLAVAREHCPQVAIRPTPGESLALAREWAEPEDLIGVAGSLYLVGAVLALFKGPGPV